MRLTRLAQVSGILSFLLTIVSQVVKQKKPNIKWAKRTPWIFGALFILSVFAIVLLPENDNGSSPNHNATAAMIGNNSPSANVSKVASGGVVNIDQAGRDLTVIHETPKPLKAGSVDLQGTVHAGDGGQTPGGDVTIKAGNGVGDVSGGDVHIGPGDYRAGDGGASGSGGNFTIKAGDANVTQDSGIRQNNSPNAVQVVQKDSPGFQLTAIAPNSTQLAQAGSNNYQSVQTASNSVAVNSAVNSPGASLNSVGTQYNIGTQNIYSSSDSKQLVQIAPAPIERPAMNGSNESSSGTTDQIAKTSEKGLTLSPLQGNGTNINLVHIEGDNNGGNIVVGSGNTITIGSILTARNVQVEHEVSQQKTSTTDQQSSSKTKTAGITSPDASTADNLPIEKNSYRIGSLLVKVESIKLLPGDNVYGFARLTIIVANKSETETTGVALEAGVYDTMVLGNSRGDEFKTTDVSGVNTAFDKFGRFYGGVTDIPPRGSIVIVCKSQVRWNGRAGDYRPYRFQGGFIFGTESQGRHPNLQKQTVVIDVE